MRFVTTLNFLRQNLPVLRRNRFLTGEYNPVLDVTDAKWLAANGEELTPERWNDPALRCFGVVIDGRAQSSGIPRPASDITLMLMFNADHREQDFVMPNIPGPDQWTCLLDTNQPQRKHLPVVQVGESYQMMGRSLALFALEAQGQVDSNFARIRDFLLRGTPGDQVVVHPERVESADPLLVPQHL